MKYVWIEKFLKIFYLFVNFIFICVLRKSSSNRTFPKTQDSICGYNRIHTYICTTEKPKWEIFYLNDIQKDNNNSAGRQEESWKKHVS